MYDARYDDWIAKCGLCDTDFVIKFSDCSTNPGIHGTFCPDCTAAKRVAPGVLYWCRRDPAFENSEMLRLERKRQIEVEGWTPEHDDSLEFNELEKAAAAYTMSACGYLDTARDLWPSEWIRFNPKTPMGDLRRAGALILAAMEKRQRETEIISERNNNV